MKNALGSIIKIVVFMSFCLIVSTIYSEQSSGQVKQEDIFSQQDSSNIVKVVSALRTLSFSGLSWQPLTPKNPEKNVLLVLRIEGISREEFQNTVDSNGIIIRSGDDQYPLDFSQNIGTATIHKDGKPRTISPWIIITFSIPKELVNLTLDFGEAYPVDIKLKNNILEQLRPQDLVP